MLKLKICDRENKDDKEEDTLFDKIEKIKHTADKLDSILNGEDIVFDMDNKTQNYSEH